jgi:hypothetical protein
MVRPGEGTPVERKTARPGHVPAAEGPPALVTAIAGQ